MEFRALSMGSEAFDRHQQCQVTFGTSYGARICENEEPMVTTQGAQAENIAFWRMSTLRIDPEWRVMCLKISYRPRKVSTRLDRRKWRYSLPTISVAPDGTLKKKIAIYSVS